METDSHETIAPAIFYEALYKIVIVGDSGVGKTNILSRYCRGTFLQEEKSTIGVEFATKVVTTPDGKRVKAQIWDTAGQERYRAITSAYYRGSLGAILVFSLTDLNSFSHVTRWLSEVVDHTAPDIAVILIGTKSDLAEDRKVSRSDAEKLGFPYFECSAKTGENVQEAVNKLIFAVHTQQNKAKPITANPPVAPITLVRPAMVNDDISERSCCGF